MSEVVVRPARVEDRDTVLAFCANTWESGDYIEDVWDAWLYATHGLMLVATLAEHPVGLLNLRILGNDEAWLEGVRVDPQYRRQGLGRAMYLAALEEALRRNAVVARLIVEAENMPSRRQIEGLQMRTVGAFSSYVAGPLSMEAQKRPVHEHTELAKPEDLAEIIHYLNVSNVFPAVGGLYYYRFTARTISAELLEEKIAAGNVYLLRRWDRLDGLAIAEPSEEQGLRRLSVGYIDGTAIEAISLIAYDLRRQLGENGLEQVRIYAPDLMLVRDALDGLEYTSRGMIFYTYERGLV